MSLKAPRRGAIGRPKIRKPKKRLREGRKRTRRGRSDARWFFAEDGGSPYDLRREESNAMERKKNIHAVSGEVNSRIAEKGPGSQVRTLGKFGVG